jgi:hypothetical protein
MTRALRNACCAVVATLTLGGCATLAESPLTSWMTSIPAPSFAWLLGGGHKPGPLPALTPTVTPRIAWQQGVGKAAPGLAPAITPSAMRGGAMTSLDTLAVQRGLPSVPNASTSPFAVPTTTSSSSAPGPAETGFPALTRQSTRPVAGSNRASVPSAAAA